MLFYVFNCAEMWWIWSPRWKGISVFSLLDRFQSSRFSECAAEVFRHTGSLIMWVLTNSYSKVGQKWLSALWLMKLLFCCSRCFTVSLMTSLIFLCIYFWNFLPCYRIFFFFFVHESKFGRNNVYFYLGCKRCREITYTTCIIKTKHSPLFDKSTFKVTDLNIVHKCWNQKLLGGK